MLFSSYPLRRWSYYSFVLASCMASLTHIYGAASDGPPVPARKPSDLERAILGRALTDDEIALGKIGFLSVLGVCIVGYIANNLFLPAIAGVGAGLVSAAFKNKYEKELQQRIGVGILPMAMSLVDGVGAGFFARYCFVGILPGASFFIGYFAAAQGPKVWKASEYLYTALKAKRPASEIAQAKEIQEVYPALAVMAFGAVAMKFFLKRR